MNGLTEEQKEYMNSFNLHDEVIIRDSNNMKFYDKKINRTFDVSPGVMSSMLEMEGKRAKIIAIHRHTPYDQYRINLDDYIYSGLFFDKTEKTDENKNFLLDF